MVLNQLDTARFINVYIGQGLVFAYFIFLTIKILQRDKKKLNLILSGYYIFIAVGLIINFIYAPLSNPEIIKILNSLTNFFVFFGMIFLFLYNLILYRAPKSIRPFYLLIIIIIYGILLSFIFFIPGGVQIDPSTNWKPVWSVLFFVYLIIVVSSVCIIPSLLLSVLLYKRFQNENIKKRWRCFILGISGVYFIMYCTMISNTLNDPNFRFISAIISISMFLWGYLMYYGVGRGIKR